MADGDGLRAGFIPRWLALSGYGIALVLLLTIDVTPWVELLFPFWILPSFYDRWTEKVAEPFYEEELWSNLAVGLAIRSGLRLVPTRS